MALANEYKAQADKFLLDTGTKIKVEYLRYGQHFTDEKEKRDIYKITYTRGRRSFFVEFGQSIVHSTNERIIELEQQLQEMEKEYKRSRRFSIGEIKRVRDELAEAARNVEQPSAYDALTCLEKYTPDTFVDFCAEYGYDTDSKKAEKTFYACKKQWQDVQRLWTDEEIEKLAEIQ